MQSGVVNANKQGKTAVRDYLYTLGGNYGLKKEDVDNIIKYDNDTGEIRLGGINMGKPYTVVDGVSYDDEEKIKSDWEKYVSASGLKKTPDAIYQSLLGNGEERSAKQWDDNEKAGKMITDKFLSEYDKSQKNITDDEDFKKVYNDIYDKFDYDSIVARDNAVADGASANGGNIDSYAAANAIRQQAALKAQGGAVATDAALKVVNDKNNRAIAILDRLSGERTNNFNNQQTNIMTNVDSAQNIAGIEEAKKDGKVNRDKVLTDTSGYNTGLVKYSHSALFNPDGSLKNTERDYTADYNYLNGLLSETTDAQKKAEIEDYMNEVAEAHNWKVLNIPKYSGYTLLPVGKEKSFASQQNDTAERVSLGEAAANAAANETKAQYDYAAEMSKQENERYIAGLNNQADMVIAEMQYGPDKNDFTQQEVQEIKDFVKAYNEAHKYDDYKKHFPGDVIAGAYGVYKRGYPDKVGTDTAFGKNWDVSILSNARTYGLNNDQIAYLKAALDIPDEHAAIALNG